MDQYQARLKESVHEKLGKYCACCGSREELQLDHVRGNGVVERRILGGSWTGVYRKVRDLPTQVARENYQMLCAKCNRSKHDGIACELVSFAEDGAFVHA